MQKRSCALIGPGKGPYIRARRGMIRVRGLPEGEKALATLNNGGVSEFLHLEKNGEFDFAAAFGLHVSYEGRALTFVALVETEG